MRRQRYIVRSVDEKGLRSIGTSFATLCPSLPNWAKDRGSRVYNDHSPLVTAIDVGLVDPAWLETNSQVIVGVAAEMVRRRSGSVRLLRGTNKRSHRCYSLETTAT